MKTKCYPVYDFDELPEDIQDHAVEKLYDCNVDFSDWDEFILDEWKDEKLPAFGYIDPKIYYSGFSSQGDGACFTANVDALKWIETHKAKSELKALYNHINKGGYISINIETSGRYCHEQTMSVNVELDDWGTDIPEKVQEQANQLERWILEDARGEARKIYKELEKDYDYATSREAIIETIEANEWTFDDRGNLDNL
jgi:hypothetical protein